MPFFALRGPAQAECEAPGLTVWRMPQNLLSLGPPIPPPRDASLGAPAPTLSALFGRGGLSWGLPSIPRKSRPPLGAWLCQQSDAGTLGVLPGGPPGGGFVGLSPTLRPACPAAVHHLEPRMGPFGGWPQGPAARIALRPPGRPSPSQQPPASRHPHPGPWGQAPVSSSGTVIVTSLLCLKR